MTIEQINKLYYQQQLSTTDTAKLLGKTVWQVIAFMKKHNLPRRTSAETQKLDYLRLPPSYKKKVEFSPQEKELYVSGLMLYWGEGAKNTGAVVDLANSDPKMIQLFIKFLRDIYLVKEEKFRVLIYCYQNQNEKQLKRFWSQLLNVPETQFLKSYIRKDFDPLKINKMSHGVVHVRYYDKKLYSQIQKDLAIIAQNFLKK